MRIYETHLPAVQIYNACEPNIQVGFGGALYSGRSLVELRTAADGFGITWCGSLINQVRAIESGARKAFTEGIKK
ncbi:MAG: hypothetical protein MI750_10295 [Xanthomonadales bacterium]|nr:hypothetical protein [Xanthomonadales bacterium]